MATYEDIAHPVGQPRAVRAVGSAVGAKDGGWVRHGQQDPRSTSNALLGASVANKLLQVRRVIRGQIDQSL